MKLEDIKSAFKKDFPEEMTDCNNYLDMAMAAQEIDPELSHGLYLIAHDEFTHAKFIHHCLNTWGYDVPEAEATKWHELKERVRHTFR